MPLGAVAERGALHISAVLDKLCDCCDKGWFNVAAFWCMCRDLPSFAFAERLCPDRCWYVDADIVLKALDVEETSSECGNVPKNAEQHSSGDAAEAASAPPFQLDKSRPLNVYIGSFL
jgi:hypothetical protein